MMLNMRFKFLCSSFVAAFLWSGPVLADPSMECGINNGSQVDIDNCVIAMLKVVDIVVDTSFKDALKNAKEIDKGNMTTNTAPALQAAQDEWVKYRKEHCLYISNTFGGGSQSGIAFNSCNVEKGRERVRELQNYITFLAR